jgi:hypothetical protein
MFTTKTHSSIAAMVLGVACLAAPTPGPAAQPVKISGAIVGTVRDAGGIPQMGATVTLYNRQERVFEKALTDGSGQFHFASLFPDIYSVRVTLATYMPALKRDILVQPGMRSILNVNLNSLFSTIQIAHPVLENGSLMTDEWKWVLRSDSAARPITRFLEEQRDAALTASMPRAAVFSNTRGILRVSAGEGPLASGIGNQADLGTTFALATSLYGNNMLQLSGTLGYGSATGVPTAAFRTTYSHGMAGGPATSPEISVTMRQLFLPARLSAAAAGNGTAMPMLRTMSAGFDDHSRITDDLQIHYGINLDAVSFLDHLNYLSPYARLEYSLGPGEELAFTYTSGNARPDLSDEREATGEADLQHGLDTLAMFPNVSLRGGRAKVQRGEEYEVTYSRKIGSRTFYLSGYRESVSNAALTIVAPAGLYTNGDILPDLFSGSSVFNAGDYQTGGYMAGVEQRMGEHFSATITYGSVGALSAENRELVSNSPDELRSMIHAGRKHAATARIKAVSPWSGTHLIASYQWASDPRSALPGQLYSTQALRCPPGLNIYVRQPIPVPTALPWRMEATADLRNLLAQGYLPLNMANGQQVLLVETPRSFRGGLSFIF